jgi:hypothetical protein
MNTVRTKTTAYTIQFLPSSLLMSFLNSISYSMQKIHYRASDLMTNISYVKLTNWSSSVSKLPSGRTFEIEFYMAIVLSGIIYESTT